MRPLRAVLCAAALACAPRPAAADDRPGTAVPVAGVPSATELEARGATIGTVHVYVQNIFDNTDPRESQLLYRLANDLHYRTRERTVRNQLLFAPGQRLRVQKLEETERILRSRVYLNDAWAVPVSYDAGRNVVDIAVTVRDVWTLDPSLSLGRAGGKNGSREQLEDENFLGLGSTVALSHSHDVDRTSDLLSYFDPNAFGSWWQLGLGYQDNSDGRVKSLSLVQPFYSLDTHSSGGLNAYDGTSRVSLYSNGVIADQFEERHSLHQLSYGWSEGLLDGWTQRWYAGVRYDEATFQARPDLPPPQLLPADRKFVYPWVGWQAIEDHYEKAQNINLIGRTEDLYLGRSLYAEVGYSDQTFGGRGRSILVQSNGLDGWRFGSSQMLFLSASLAGRLDDGVAHNVSLTSAGQYFLRLSRGQALYASLSATTTRRLDPDQQLLLGGDSGLRGYPIRFQGGSSSALLTLEHRLYTDWYPFRLLRVGGVVFFDAGRTWGRDFAGAESLGLLKDLGLGIRFGNNRSGLGNVVHVDLSYALDAPAGVKRVEVTVATRSTF